MAHRRMNVEIGTEAPLLLWEYLFRNFGILSLQCMSLKAIYLFPRSVSLFCWRKYVDRSWGYINRSQTHECWNWGWGRAIPRKGIHKGDFRCSVAPLIIIKHRRLTKCVSLRDRKWRQHRQGHTAIEPELQQSELFHICSYRNNKIWVTKK